MLRVFNYNTSSFLTSTERFKPCSYFHGTYFILSVVFQLKLAATSKRWLPKANPLINEVVNKLRRVSIANRQYQRVFKRVIELKCFSRAISNDEKVEKEIDIQREAIQFTDGARQKFVGNPNSNCCGRVRESKLEFKLKTSLVERSFLNDFAVKSLNSRCIVAPLWELYFDRY